MSERANVVEAAALALVAGREEPLAVDPERLSLVTQALESYHQDPALPDVVEQLCLFACWIGSAKASPTARDALLRVAEGALPALKALGDRAEALVRDVEATRASRDFSRFTGRARERFEPQPPGDGAVAAGPLARFTLRGGGQEDPKKGPGSKE